MTNEQLYVLLRKYYEQLEIAIAELDKYLPQDLPRHELVNMLEQSKPGRLVCLDKLESLRLCILDDARILAGRAKR